MAVLDLAGIVSDRLSRPRADVNATQIEIMRADLWPRDHAEALSLLVLVTLFGATPATAVDTAKSVSGLVDRKAVRLPGGEVRIEGGDLSAVRFVAGMLRAFLNEPGKYHLPPSLAIRSVIRCELGDGPAITVDMHCDDGVESLSFTDDPHGYRPDRDVTISLSMGLPGRILFRLGRDLNDFLHSL